MTIPTLAALLDVAHDLVAQRIFDADVVLTLLSKLPGADFDAQIRGAVRHAQITAEAARDRSTAHTAVARFALARVVTLLETECGN